MKTLRLALAGAVAVVVALFATLGPALSYPLSDLVVTGGTLVGGNPIKVTATASPSTEHAGEKCIQLSITYEGETITASDTNTLSHVFDTRVVSKVESDPVTALCTYNKFVNNQAMAGGSAGKLGMAVVKVEMDSIGAENTITLLPKGGGGGDNGGFLPNTGGERLAWLLIGGLLVVVGGGAIVASRRRTS